MINHIADATKKVQPAPAPLPEEVGRMATWLDGLAKQHGKGVADNIDARSLGRAAMLLTTQARRLAEVEAERDEYRACAVKQDYARKDFICAMWTQVDRYEKDRANLNATCAALAVAAKRDRELTESAEAHISDLARRLAEAEAENGRFADMLESSVADWRKLYAEERAERVRIEGILLNDVQDERQESDEHIKGLVTVIKTQDKNIGDLKAHIQRIGVDHDDVEARAESAEARVRELEEENVRLRPRAEIAGSLLTRTSKAEKRCRELEEELTLCLKEAPVGILAAICDMNKILGLEMPKTSYTEIPPAIQAVVARAEAAESRVRELEAKKDAAFWQGWALLAGFITGSHDEQSLVEEAAREHGVTLALLEASSCDEFELEPLRRKVFMSAALAATEVPNA